MMNKTVPAVRKPGPVSFAGRGASPLIVPHSVSYTHLQKTVAKDLAALSQAFTDAVDSEVIDRNPCTGVSIPPDRAGEKLHIALYPDEPPLSLRRARHP